LLLLTFQSRYAMLEHIDILPLTTREREETGKANFEKILRSKSFLEEHITKQVTFASPIIERDQQGILHPNTINVIQGKAGVHKSRLVESLCSCLLTNKPENNFLGFRKRLLDFNAYSVLYIDTERNLKDQYLYALQQIKIKAGYAIETDLPNFDFISLIEIPRDERFEAVKQYLEYVRSKYSNHIFIVLDVLTDCISNFNDPRESLKLVDLLNVMINRYNVTFLCVIHENPTDNSNKARGHLGTEIMNKASCQMQISFEKDRQHRDTDLIKVKYLKVRVGRKPDPFFLQYSAEEKGLVVADIGLVSEVMNSKGKINLHDLKERLTDILIKPMERKRLIAILTDEFSCGQRTVEERLKAMIENKEAILNDQGQDCCLEKETENRLKVYRLSPIDTNPN